MSNSSTLKFPWLLEGVDFNLPGNGGLECLNHVTLSKRLFDGIVGSVVAIVSIKYGFHLKSKKFHTKSNIIIRKMYFLVLDLFFKLDSQVSGLKVRDFSLNSKLKIFLNA